MSGVDGKMDKRMAMGYKLFRDGKVKEIKMAPEYMKFQVASKDKVYEVECFEGYWSCDCSDFFYRRIKEFEELEDYGFGIKPDKHIWACFFYSMAKLGMSDQSKLDKFVESLE
jgi:hypothetical protein